MWVTLYSNWQVVVGRGRYPARVLRRTTNGQLLMQQENDTLSAT